MINPWSHNDTIHPICFLEPHDHHVREVLFELMHLIKYLLALLEEKQVALVAVRVHQVDHLVVDQQK